MRQSTRVLAAFMGLVILAWLALAAQLSAQTSSASAAIAGTVKDKSGAVLPGVTVEVSSAALIEKMRTTVTDEGGQYKIVNLPVGTYSVTFMLPGFNTFRRDGVELSTNFTAPVNAELAVGTLQETITVSGAAPVVDVQNTAARNVISKSVLDTIPTGKTMLSVLGMTPGMSGNPSSQDVGGTKGDQMPYFTFHGSASTDSKLQSNGFNVNVAGASGRTYVPSPINTQEIAVELGGGNAEQPTSGIQFNYISRSGSNTFAGDIAGSFTNQKLQSSNFNSDLAALGMKKESINRLDKTGDIGIGVGGPIRVDKLWYFASYRYWTSGTYVAGQFFDLNSNPHLPYVPDRSRPVINDYWGHDASLRLTWQASTRNKFNFHYEFEKRCDCHHLQGNNANFAGVSAGEATDHQIISPADLLQAEWTFPASNRLLLAGGVQFSRPTYTTGPQPDVDLGLVTPTGGSVPIVDSFTGQRWGGESGVAYNMPSHRNKIEPRFSATYVTGSHALKGGFNLVHEWNEKIRVFVPGNMNWTYNNGVPTSVAEWGTPYQSTVHMNADAAVYGQDQWTVKRLTLNYGLRFDYVQIDVPAQTLEATVLRPVVVNTTAVDCSPCQTDFNPRISAAYDVFGNGKTAIKGGFGRYNAARAVSLFNPALLLTTNASRSWSDTNGNFFPDCDLLSNAANGECGAQSNARFGTAAITTNVDDNARNDFRKYNWQVTAGVQQELVPGTSLAVNYVNTRWYNFTVTDHLAVTAADFDQYCVPVPTDARLPLSGQSLCGLYAPSAAKFSAVSTNDLIVRADDFGTQKDYYNGFDVTINSRLPRGAFISGGTSTGREVWNNCYAASRPDLVPTTFTNFASAATTLANNPGGFCKVHPPFQTQFKMQGSYPLPWWDIQLSGAFQSAPGIAILASWQVPNALVQPSLGRPLPGNAASVNVANIIAPLTQFEPRINQLDFRLSKAVALGGGHSFKVNVDLYNALNSSAILSENTTYGPNWKRPGQILDGRIVKFGGQILF